MTDITDQDRRLALRWCDMLGDSSHHKEAAATRRVILATVEAPAPTLAEELENITYHLQSWTATIITRALNAATTRAEQMEQDAQDRQEWNRRITEQVATLTRERDEARAEVERLTAERDRIANGRCITYAEVDGKPVQKDAESNAETPDPADVKPGEAWLIRVRGRDAVAVRDGHEEWPWSVAFICGDTDDTKDDVVTLLHRLVPAPRVITNPDELEQLAATSIIRDSRGETFERTEDGWGRISIPVKAIRVPVTVLWEPEA